MKILFMMDKRADAGSIQAVANYVRTGDRMRHIFALYGREDPRFPSIRFSTDFSQFDYVVFIIESSLDWLSGLRMPQVLSCVPRHKRAILDADCMYNQVICIDNYDRNHSREQGRKLWALHYHELADVIMQPTPYPRESDAKSVLFYGYDPGSVICNENRPKKRFDILHVGHNWWRWRQVSSSLLPALERTRDRLGEVCFMGSWWDAPPAGAADMDLEMAFGVDPEWFQRLRIHIEPPVPYTQVIHAMSSGRINLMTQRPIFRYLRILTSKYFEIFAANTIPLVMLEPHHAASVYGPAGRELALNNQIEKKLQEVLERPAKYREIVREVRSHLAEHHSYEKRVEQLVETLNNHR